ncbi:Hypothetical predicted protein [Mytilus galloprovincialis]|uniref:C-type lectin domain-containing protein n=1 Tax=Mytilus galloprovincialis TaxID=29158 RepID=A0A8B6EH48_MYTGA|nr:Hypothetical predicted protein [Mytilus galloprovincialis]
MEYLGGINIESLKNTYQVEDNVGVAFNIALLQCLMLCLRTDTCLTLFYKNVNEQCILHSKTFHYKSPTGIEMGWEVYQIVDSGLPDTAYVCVQGSNYAVPGVWTYDDGTPFGYTNWEAGQPNGGNQPRNLGIDVCATAGLPDTAYVCVQGSNYAVPGVWTYDDGTPFGYTNWEAGQPNGGNQPRNLGIDVCATGLLWHDYPTSESKTCSYVCEKR